MKGGALKAERGAEEGLRLRPGEESEGLAPPGACLE